MIMSDKPTDPARFLPLKPDVFEILLVLLDGEAHGYRIMKEVGVRAGRAARLQPGALYRFLRHMLDSGLVAETEAPGEADRRDQRRRYYRITPFGRAVAQAEARRLNALLGFSRRHHLLDDTESA
jgi:DNA-binding PadR family transcriptional regulator